MIIVTIDGPSRSGKTSVTTDLNKAFSLRTSVTLGVLGDFFRSLTSVVLEYVDQAQRQNIDQLQLEKLIQRAVRDERLYDLTYDWGDLHNTAIESLVSAVGKSRSAQDAVRPWFAKVAQNAMDTGTQLLIIEGRNPRRRLQAAGLRVDTDLFIDCGELEAARRQLEGTVGTFTDEELEAERQRIAERRRYDAERPENPFEYPQNPVRLELGHDQALSEVVQRAYIESWMDAPEDQQPRTIYFDTTNVSKEQKLEACRQLVEATIR